MAGFIQRAAAAPDRLRFEATVVGCEGAQVELDETYFFAESGGQPSDRGELAGCRIVDVQVEDDRIVHTLDQTPNIVVGETVSGVIDPEFRRYCRRAHTASHVLYGAARREVNGLGYGGFEIDERKVRVDFESTDPMDIGTILSLEKRANRAVWDSRAVTWAELPREEAETSDEIAFNAATEEIFAERESVRIVEIEGWDRAACGGTHLHNTAEIGPISVLDRSNPGSGLTRVEFAVGPAAIDHFSTVHTAARTAARELDTTPVEVQSALAELKETVSERGDRIETIEKKLLDERLAHLEIFETNSNRWKIGTIPDVDAAVMTETLRSAVGDDGVSVIVGLAGEETSSITVASDGEKAAHAIVASVTDVLGGGGGGNDEFAQGGGIPKSPDDIATFLHESIVETDID